MVNVWYQPWRNQGSPYRLCQPADDLRRNLVTHGITVFHYPNDDHLTATNPQDHTPYSTTKWPIGVNGIDGIGRADDIMPRSSSLAHRIENANIARRIIRDRDAGKCKAIKYLNWTDEFGVCLNENWKSGKRVTTISTDKGHIHVSFRSDMDNDTSMAEYDPLGVDMTYLDQTTAALYSKLMYEMWPPTREEWIAAKGDPKVYDLLAQSGSGVNQLALFLRGMDSKLTQLLARPAVDLTSEQIEAIATAVANHPDTPLSEADKPVIAEALRDVLRSV